MRWAINPIRLLLRTTTGASRIFGSRCQLHDNIYEDIDDDGDYQRLCAEHHIIGRKPIDDDYRLLVIHPRIYNKHGRREATTSIEHDEHQLNEACALVRTLPRWHVANAFIMRTDRSTRMWADGRINELVRLQRVERANAIMVNADMLQPAQHAKLSAIFGVPIFDRYSVVLQIFKTYATTREAHLQIALAEIPYLRQRLDFLESRASLEVLKFREHSLRKRLATLRESRDRERERRLDSRNATQQPTVAIIGYTNAGKTSLISRLTGDHRAKPVDRLFATLDSAVYRAYLPCNIAVHLVDTIGFISNLPISLIASFAATLDDVRYAHLLVHVRDISHPDTVEQNDQVHATLKSLQLPSTLIETMIEARNKCDLLDATSRDRILPPNAVLISCTTGDGINDLVQRIEQQVLRITDSQRRVLKLSIDSIALNYIYSEKLLVDDPVPSPCGQFLFVNTLMNAAQYAIFQSKFGAFEKKEE